MSANIPEAVKYEIIVEDNVTGMNDKSFIDADVKAELAMRFPSPSPMVPADAAVPSAVPPLTATGMRESVRRICKERWESWKTRFPVRALRRKHSQTSTDGEALEAEPRGGASRLMSSRLRNQVKDALGDAYVTLCAFRADPATRGDRPGRLMWLTMDSGAGKSVTSRKLAAMFQILPSVGSRSGQKFTGPGGDVYANEGEVNLPFVTEGGNNASGDFQVVDRLDKTLAAISDSCDRGNCAIFDNDGSFLINRESIEGEEIQRLTAKANVEMYRKNCV